MRKKRAQNEIYKILQSKIIENQNNLTKYNDETALLQGEKVKIMDNLVFKKIRDYYQEYNQENLLNNQLAKDIVNVVVPMDKGKGGERAYKKLAHVGFEINNVPFHRIMSGGGQIRRNTISFIRKQLYEYVFNALLCGLKLDDFGDCFNAAKFNAYLGLNMSGSVLLKKFPKVCIIDDYEEIIPNIKVNYIHSEEVKYLVLPDGDSFLNDIKDEFVFYDCNNSETTVLDKACMAIRKSDMEKKDATIWKVFSGMRKYPEIVEYNKIGKRVENKDKKAPPLNSFDGQGLANPKWVESVAKELGLDYIPSQMIIRAPWVKGLVATFPISAYLKEKGVGTVTSSCGDILKVDEVDIFISKSQFKMHQIYQKKVELLKENISAWEYHQKAMKDNGLLWGVVMPNKKVDDNEKESNYQYNQALNLYIDSDIDKLTEKTEKFLKKLCNHDIEQVYRTLAAHTNVESEPWEEVEEGNAAREAEYRTLLQKIISHNVDMLKDRYIQSLINKECKREFKKAMLGKLLFDGNFQFIVSDPVAQAEWIYKNHTVDESGNHPNVKVEGVVKAGEIYSNYWKRISKQNKKKEECIVLMRSPLIDQHEIAKADLIMNDIEEFKYLESGIILSIHDLFTLQMQNCDFDGDRCFSSNMDILKKGCLDTSYPLYYEPGKAGIVGTITDNNIIEADVRGLNSKVGQLSNKSTSFYAMLPLYNEKSKYYQFIKESITVLGEVVGTEIDKIKTGIAPVQPYNWKAIQVTYDQKEVDGKIEKVSAYSEEQERALYHHNSLIPDLKPYFFRYNYPYLEKDIKILENEIEKECKYNYGIRLKDLLEKYDNKEFYNKVESLFEIAKNYKIKNNKEYEFNSEDLLYVRLYNTLTKYKRTYPVLDTPCIMNKICHKFEKMQIELGNFNDGKDILKEYALKDLEYDINILKNIERYMIIYKKHRKMITKNNNTTNDSNGKFIAKDTKERLDALLCYTRKKIYNLFKDKNEKSLILSYLIQVLKGKDVQYIWMIMDDDILKIIPEKRFIKKRDNE